MPSGMIRMKIDNRYRDDNIVKKNGVLIGNAKTITIKTMENPADPLHPFLSVGNALGKAMKKHGIL
jgi:hypothetical protein